jgi:hypothetical protein
VPLTAAWPFDSPGPIEQGIGLDNSEFGRRFPAVSSHLSLPNNIPITFPSGNLYVPIISSFGWVEARKMIIFKVKGRCVLHEVHSSKSIIYCESRRK